MLWKQIMQNVFCHNCCDHHKHHCKHSIEKLVCYVKILEELTFEDMFFESATTIKWMWCI